jgi:hypothetical protein
MGVPILNVLPRSVQPDQVIYAADHQIHLVVDLSEDNDTTLQDSASLAPESKPELTLSVHDSISLGLNFLHGINFAKDVRNKFSSVVHSSDKSRHFTILVSFH